MIAFLSIARQASSRQCSVVLALLCAAIASAQTQPVAQPLPYAQDFGTLAHNSNTFPAGWQGWRIFTGATTTYITDAPTADVPLTASANAANNSGALYNYNGKLGILNTTGMNAALVLSINTTHRYNVQVGYTLMTIRNPWDGSTNTRRNRTTLQYRIGNEGPFTAVEVLSYGTGTTAQTGLVTTPIDPASFSVTLPASCSYQSEVQLRWVTRDSTGTGARPSIALDDVSVNGTWFPMYTGGDGRGDASGSYHPPAPLADIFRGGNGRGDVSASFVAPPPTASIFKGGTGRGDVSGSFTAPPVTASIYRGGDGRGDIAGSFVAPSPTASIFQGGNGRGDVSGTFTTPPVAASIYRGGDGRGDIAGSFIAPPPTASIFKGGDGRGDVSGSFTTPPITASIYRGGDGRGDIAGSFVTPPLTASIFKGGDGRGDVSGSFTAPPVTASIYRGGDGRGDIAGSFVTPPPLANIFRGGVGRGDVSMALVLFEPLAITTVLQDEYLCTGLPFEVAFIATGAFNEGNVFTAELSDEVGDFTNALTIGSITGTASDTIMATIPNGTLESYGYRIRVVANDPVLVGTDNGAYLFVLDGSTDSDGDGEPDCLDTCPWLPGLSDGQPCDDGDPNTINDVVSTCYCQGCAPARFGYDQGHLAVCDAAPDFTFTCWNLNAPGVFTSTWSLNGVDLGQRDNVTITAPNPGPGEHTYLLIADNECGVDTFYLHVSVRGAFTAGSDSTYTTCNATGGFLMNDLLSSDADIGGTWFNADINFGPGYIPYFQALETTAGTYLNGYTFESPGCTPDTAWITVVITDGGTYVFYDEDLDGYGAPGNMTAVCEVGPGYSLNSDDCNDADPNLTVPGNPCDDGNPATIDDVVTDTCTCAGTPIICTENIVVDLRTDLNSQQTSFQLLADGSNIVVCQGGVSPAFPADISSPIVIDCCVPAGCYRLVVSDSGGDGFVTGGYQVREQGANGRRIIDNLGNFINGSGSAIATTYDNGTFCLPIGDDKLIFSSCDKLDWTVNKFIVVAENLAVSAQFGLTNATSGYEFWFFDPNGSYSFRRFRSHATSDGYGTGALRANHFKINGWVNSVSTPHLPANKLLNVRIRGRVAGNNLPFGQACLFKIDAALAACPRVKLQDDPANPEDYSCGVTRSFGGVNSANNRITANPPQPIPVVASSSVRYQFRFRIPGEGVCIVRPPQTSARLQLNWNIASGAPLQCSKTYDVDVRVSLDGGVTWCFGPAGTSTAATCGDNAAWGKVCKVTISACAQATGGSSSMVLDAGSHSLTMHPNPNRGDQLFVSLSSVEEGVSTVNMDIFDLTGNKVAARTIAVQASSSSGGSGFVKATLDMNEDIANGVYLVNIIAGGQVYTERLVIQK